MKLNLQCEIIKQCIECLTMIKCYLFMTIIDNEFLLLVDNLQLIFTKKS